MPDLADPIADEVVRRVAAFARLLRTSGAEVAGNRVADALEALAAVGLRSRDDCYWALRCTLVARQQDIPIFDTAFAAYWTVSGPQLVAPTPEAARAEPDEGDPDPGDDHDAVDSAAGRAVMGDDDADEDADALAEEAGATWSATERLRALDFADYTENELRAARRLMADIAGALPRRCSRRLRAARDGRVLDRRRTLQSAMRTDGYPLERYWRRARIVPRKVVFVVDISGSMAAYARVMIMFLQATVRAGRKVEAFAFGTRLTRVTAYLRGHDPELALRAASKAVPDWAGGTRIAGNLKVLNDVWARRGTTRGAVVVILSDGWERGDPRALAVEMERLARAAHTVVWINPLAGEEGYEPLAQGMAAALPYIDHFLPGHNLRSLESLAALLESLPVRR